MGDIMAIMVRAISLCLTDSTCGSRCWAAAVGYVPWHCHGMACHGYDEIQLRLQPMQSEWPWNGTLDDLGWLCIANK